WDAVVHEPANRLPHRVLARERLRQQVRRGADLERDLGVPDRVHQRRVASGEDAVPEAVRAQRIDDLADLLDAHVATLLADVNRDAETAVARELDLLADLRVVVTSSAGARARDVDSDDPARSVPERLLDDHHVLVGSERAVHHQDETRPYLRVLERRTIE